MKLQYLGDARDAFKWDLLHWICTKSFPPFDELVYIPMLTPDIQGSNEGNTPHHWFECQNFIRPFLASLRKEPRSLLNIIDLGKVEPSEKQFLVSVRGIVECICAGKQRAEYWTGFQPEKFHNSLLFFDPDNGFETKTQSGTKWIRHSELKELFAKLPETSAVVVYQHRPHRTWHDMLLDLKQNLNYVHTAVAAHESNLAFVAMAGASSTGNRILATIQNYAEEHSVVSHTVLKDG